MPTTLTREQITDRLCALAAEQVSVARDQVSIDTHLFNDLNFDSLDAVEYVMLIEEEFEVSVTDGLAEDVKTVRQAVDAVVSLLQ